MSNYVPDNYDAFLAHQAKQDAWLRKRPICEECDKPIQDDYLYDVDGMVLCEKCMKEQYRKDTEDYER